MASCACCGTGLRDGATHCTTCGTPTGVAPAAGPVVSSSPFEPETSWIDPPSPFETAESWESPVSVSSPARHAAPAPRRSGIVKLVLAAALVAAVAALLAVVALPRLLPQFDPQKYVGVWAYTGNTAAKVEITRRGSGFTIVFVDQNGARQSLPGTIADKNLVVDYAALGPQGKIVKKLAESIGAKLSFSYRKSDDRLLLTGANRDQGSFTIVMARSSSG
jgi:hypothetical protein